MDEPDKGYQQLGAAPGARIGLVMPLASQTGGAEALLLHLMRVAAGRTVYHCAFLEEGPLVEEARTLGHAAVVFQATRLRDPVNFLRTCRALRRWIRQERLALVVSWMPKAQLYAGIAALGLPVRVAWFQHGVPGPGALERITAALPAHGTLCCSEASRMAQLRIAPRRPAYVCYPGVPVAESQGLSQADARARLGLPQQIPIIGMVSRLERWKGVHVFLAAVSALLARHPDALFFHVGGVHALSPEYAAEIGELVARHPSGDRILLAGQRPASEVHVWQTAADIMVHPTVGVEPFGMALVEAMARGKAVVASDRGGHAEIIQHGRNGKLVPPGDPALFAASIDQLLSDSTLREGIGEQARARASAFSDVAFFHRFAELCATQIALASGADVAEGAAALDPRSAAGDDA